MRAPIGSFGEARPAADCLDELSPPVAEAVRAWGGAVSPEQVLYVDTDPAKADTAVFAEAYGPGLLDASANCVVVAAVVDRPHLVIGSGRRRGKLIVAGKVLAGLPGAAVIEGLAG